MTDEILAEILALFSRAYGTVYDGETKRVWRLLLDPLPDEAARAAAVTLCRTSPYLPKPADLFRLIHGDPESQEKRLDDEAELAVAHLESHLCDHRVLDLGPTLNAVVRAMGGVDAVATLMLTSQWRFERARVRNLYRAFRRRGVTQEQGEVLTPLSVAEGLASVPLSVYMERGIPVPMVSAPFVPEHPALPAEVQD